MTGITNPTEEYFKDGIWGWDGSRWRKLGLLFGYSDTVSGGVANDNASAGFNYLSSATVPSGEIWVIQAISGSNVNTACSKIILLVRGSNLDCPILDQVSCTADVWVTWTGSVALKAGDCLRVYFYGCTAGDDIRLRYLGYKVSVA